MKARLSYQTGWICEIQRKGWTAFKLCWRDRDAVTGNWVECSKTLPRFQGDQQTKPTLRKHAAKELKTILAPINARSAAPVAVLRGGITFNRLLELHWQDYVVNQKLRRSTIDAYNSMLENWIKPFFGDTLLGHITKSTVSEFFNDKLKAEGGLSEKYRKNVYSLLTKVFDIAVAADLLQVSPVNKMLHRPRVQRGEKPILPIGKLKAFFEALPVAWRAPIAVLLLTGMRQGELLGLRWQDIDFASKMIHKKNVVYRGELVVGLKETRKKAKARKHTIGMPTLVENILKQRLGSTVFNRPADYVFSRAAIMDGASPEDARPLDPDHIRRYVLYPAMEKAGIPIETRANGLHLFRHTVVSALAQNAGLLAAQHQAGHSSINTTADIYTHVDESQKQESAGALQEAFAAHLLPSLPASLVTS